MPDIVGDLHAFFGAVCDGMPWTARDGVTRVERFASTQGDVWKLHLEDEDPWCLKRGSPSAIRREYETLGTLADRGFDRAPEALAHVTGRPSYLVSTWMEGTPGDATDASELEALGKTLRTLHALPLDDTDPLPLCDALQQRTQAWLGRASGLLGPALCNAVSARIDLEVFRGATRVLCHRDVTASNWVRTPSGAVCLVDFGQARPDIGLGDLAKLAANWHDAPLAETALVGGYGALDERQRAQVDQLVLLHGLQTAVWGRQHDDTAFADLGDSILQRALSD